MIERKVGIVDCNNFYVSCERVFNPESIGRPTVVLSNNDGCVIARSQEAKDLGMKMGEPYFERKDFIIENNFCVYSSNYNLYGDMSDRVMSTIKKFAKEVEVYSIDECFVDFSNIPDSKLDSTLQIIRNEVKRVTGIPVSIGVGPNKTLAKLTSHIAKKQSEYNGVCSYWSLENFIDSLGKVPVDDVWGIGRQWSKKLKSLGVENVGQFVLQSDYTIRKIMNVNGLKTKMELLGIYCRPIQRVPKARKNVASTRSFGEDINCLDQISEAMYTYIQSGAKKLRDNKLASNKAIIFLCGNKHKGEKHYSSKLINFQSQTNDLQEIWSQVSPQLKLIFQSTRKYKKCGIIFNDLTPEGTTQGSLFSSTVQLLQPPTSVGKNWKMRQDFISQKFTSSWEDIPIAFF